MWALKYGWDLESKREAQQLEVPIPPWLVLGTGMYSGRPQLQVWDGNLKSSKLDSPLCVLGVDFRVINLLVDTKRFVLQLWDTAGQER